MVGARRFVLACLLGSGAAAQTAQVFLGSAAAKILRHAPVPVMIVPRRQ